MDRSAQEHLDTLVIGAGQAGLSMSYHLRKLGREHVLVERGRVGERWRSERWESLHFQFPNTFVRLPDLPYSGDQPDAFMHRDGVIDAVQRFAQNIRAPVRCGVTARRVRQGEDGKLLVDLDSHTVVARNVVCATGPYQTPTVPALATKLPTDVAQLTANRYVNADQVGAGAVLVVCSGSSGYQIAEDLNDAGCEVILAVGRHQGLPRRYRGRDIMAWLEDTGVADMPANLSVPSGPAILMSGYKGGERIDVRWLAREGVRVVGRLEHIEGTQLHFSQDLEDMLAVADQGREAWKKLIDTQLEKSGLMATAPLPEVDVAPPPLGATPAHLDLVAEDIRTVIWATGYRFDLGWIDLPVVDGDGRPVHDGGITSVPGFYFLGLPRMRKLGSAFLWGVAEDAEILATHITERQ